MTVRDYWTPMFVNLGKPDVTGKKPRRAAEAPSRRLPLISRPVAVSPQRCRIQGDEVFITPAAVYFSFLSTNRAR